MSIIKSLQDYLMLYDGMALVPLKNISTEYTPAQGGTYAIAPTGNSAVKKDILGNVTYQNWYLFFAREKVADEVDRADMYDFLEGLTAWLEEQADGGNLPRTPGRYDVTDLEAMNHMLYDIEDNGLGLFQVQINLTLKRRKKNG